MSPAPAVRLLSYNLRHDGLDSGRDAWPHRRAAALGLVGDLDPDLLAIQEAHDDQFADVRAALHTRAWVGDTGATGDHNPVGVGPRLLLCDWEVGWLSETPAVAESTGWDARFPRAFTLVRLADRNTGTRLALFNAHFDHRGARARVESARLLRRRVDALDPEVEALVVGDFNCRPGDPPYEQFVADGFDRRLRDARTAAPRTAGPDSTFTTFDRLVPGRLLDHVFVTSGVDVLAHRTVDATVGGRYPSDHLPVVVDFDL